MERELAHPPEEVWRSITEPARLSEWYPFPVTGIDLRAGGEIGFDDGEGTRSSGTVTELEPHRVFAFTEEGDLLRIELRPGGQGTLLVFTHTFDDRSAAAATATGWTCCLDALEDVTAGRPARAAESVVERHERFVREFGLDEPTVESTSDGWRPRFHRPLIQRPVDAVWSVLTEGSGVEVGGAVPSACTTEQVPAGAVVDVQPPRRLEYEWTSDGASVGRVRWELADGRGGARIVLTHSGPDELAEQRDVALRAWRHTSRRWPTASTPPPADPLRGGPPRGRPADTMARYVPGASLWRRT
nr:SRPBCC domain-containing protein [Saccharopolyspora hordei]